jgi:transcription antitermination factor NusA-like protein
LGTFWLKIEQFWPFEEISIFNNGVKLKKSSPLKLLSQSQPNFAEMILRWFPFKIENRAVLAI